MRSDMVWMPVSPDRIVCNNYLRLQLPDNLDYAARGLLNRCYDKCIRAMIVLPTLHARITVTEMDDASQADYRSGAFQFSPAHIAHTHETSHLLRVHRSCFPTGSANVVNLHARGRILRQGAADGECFIVRVRPYKNQRLIIHIVILIIIKQIVIIWYSMYKPVIRQCTI